MKRSPLTGPLTIYRKKDHLATWMEVEKVLGSDDSLTLSALIHTAVREWLLRRRIERGGQPS